MGHRPRHPKGSALVAIVCVPASAKKRTSISASASHGNSIFTSRSLAKWVAWNAGAADLAKRWSVFFFGFFNRSGLQNRAFAASIAWCNVAGIRNLHCSLRANAVGWTRRSGAGDLAAGRSHVHGPWLRRLAATSLRWCGRHRSSWRWGWRCQRFVLLVMVGWFSHHLATVIVATGAASAAETWLVADVTQTWEDWSAASNATGRAARASADATYAAAVAAAWSARKEEVKRTANHASRRRNDAAKRRKAALVSHAATATTWPAAMAARCIVVGPQQIGRWASVHDTFATTAASTLG